MRATSRRLSSRRTRCCAASESERNFARPARFSTSKTTSAQSSSSVSLHLKTLTSSRLNRDGAPLVRDLAKTEQASKSRVLGPTRATVSRKYDDSARDLGESQVIDAFDRARSTERRKATIP